MKIRLLKDLYYIDHHTMNSLKRPEVRPIGLPPSELATATDEVRKWKDDVLEVEPDSNSENAEHSDGSRWFILRETGYRFQIPESDFRVVE